MFHNYLGTFKCPVFVYNIVLFNVLNVVGAVKYLNNLLMKKRANLYKRLVYCVLL